MPGKFLTNSSWIGRTTIAWAFGIVPALFYWFAIRPPMQRIMGFQQSISQAPTQQQNLQNRVTRAAVHEQAAVSKFQGSFLAKVPIVTDTEDLVRYGAVLSSALTREANARGMQVLGVEMFNHLVKGQYVPAGSGSSADLANWPRLSPGRLTNPIRVPMLDLPSLELQMRVGGLSSARVFTFVESLASYSVLINVTGIDLEKSNEDVAFHLKMRSYYWMPADRQERN